MSTSTRTLAFLMVVGSVFSMAEPAAEHVPLSIPDQLAPVAVSADVPQHALVASMSSPLVSSQKGTTDALGTMGGDRQGRASVEWAVGLFAEAGLELPPFTIMIHEDREPCDGYQGAARLREVPVHIDVCNPHRLIIVHELAHAWDHSTLVDADREAYMEHRGLRAWNDASVAWKDRAVEDLAQVVVWGLLRIDRAQAVDGGDERGDAFTLVTGIDLTALEVPDTGVRPDRATEADVRPDDWDDSIEA